jgi:hypothetical protein
VYCGPNGIPTTSNAGGGQQIGIVIQVPTSDDPYLGFDLSLVS